MSARTRVIVGVVLLAVVGAGWWWWHRPDPGLYGGVKPFMKKMRANFDATAAELHRGQPKLPEDFTDMERLSQTAQDVFAVFSKDPRFKDPRFAACATELVRRGKRLENAWDMGSRDEAESAFQDLTAACNACHTTIGEGKAPVLRYP